VNRASALLVLTIVWFFAVCSLALAEPSQERTILGWVERVKLQSFNLMLHAKLDTGADFSSLNANNLQEFTRKDQPWVRFTVRNRYGEEVKIERPVVRITHIKGHVANQKRMVIRLGVCVANVFMEEEISLVNRAKFDYQMLIGRSFLAGKAYVDPASAYLVDPSCKS
jgi:hypothetical protein